MQIVQDAMKEQVSPSRSSIEHSSENVLAFRSERIVRLSVDQSNRLESRIDAELSAKPTFVRWTRYADVVRLRTFAGKKQTVTLSFDARLVTVRSNAQTDRLRIVKKHWCNSRFRKFGIAVEGEGRRNHLVTSKNESFVDESGARFAAELQSEIADLERTRESMARELVNLSTTNEKLQAQARNYPILQEQYKVTIDLFAFDRPFRSF